MAAKRDNGICGVGVAYDSKVAGIRMLDQPYMTDLIEANSMGHEPDLIDIYSASWGPTDDGKTVDGPRNATMRAIVRGVNEVSFGLLSYLLININLVKLINFRVEGGWATSTCGLRVMAAKTTTATVMDMRPQCGPSQLTLPLTMARMHIMMSLVPVLSPPLSATEQKIRTQEWLVFSFNVLYLLKINY